MAKTKTATNKSQAIRDALAENKAMTAKETVEYLKTKGVDTNEGLVYQVKQKLAGKRGGKKKNKGGRPKGSAAKAPAPSANGKLSIAEGIAEVQAVARKVGGLSELAKIVSALNG